MSLKKVVVGGLLGAAFVAARPIDGSNAQSRSKATIFQPSPS